ncbi:hypothetical protein C3L33_18120, partial [Rhododendron williamsianum]
MPPIKTLAIGLIALELPIQKVERADESLLPGVYKEHFTRTQPAGFPHSLQIHCAVLLLPLAAYLATRHNRAHVIALGGFLWAAATFLVGISSTFFQVAVSRGLNGIGLAIVIPSIQSLVADSTDETSRGTAFGWRQVTSSLGSIIGGLFSVLLASTSFMGIPGWRIDFHLVAFVSVIVGVLVRLFANDPRFDDGEAKAQIPRKSFCAEVKDMITEAKSAIKIPSFQIIVAQGVAGSFPWNALSIAPMWRSSRSGSSRLATAPEELARLYDSIFEKFDCDGSVFLDLEEFHFGSPATTARTVAGIVIEQDGGR